MGDQSDRLFRTPSAALEEFAQAGGRHQPPGPEAETLKPRSNPQQGGEVMMITKEQALEDLIRLEGDLGEDWEALERIRSYIGQSQPVPEGADTDLITDMLTDYAVAIDYGELDGAGRYLPCDIQEQADLLAAALESGDDDD